MNTLNRRALRMSQAFPPKRKGFPMPDDGTPNTPPPPQDWRDLAEEASTKLDAKKLTNIVSVKLRILLADDHEIVRRGIRALLEKHEGWEVCGEARDGRETVEKAIQLKPDVVILDIGMPLLNGLETTRQLLKHDPDFKVIVLTISDSDQVIREALDAGARGFVLKSDAARDLISAVDELQNKRVFFTPRVNDMVLAGFLEKSSTTEASRLPALTAREREITQLLAEGKSSKEVATLLNLSTKTVETHRVNLMRKLSFHSIRDLVVYAIRNHLIQIEAGPPPKAP
jgi:DNA-binding NarL/FixJ family response regulator